MLPNPPTSKLPETSTETRQLFRPPIHDQWPAPAADPASAAPHRRLCARVSLPTPLPSPAPLPSACAPRYPPSPATPPRAGERQASHSSPGGYTQRANAVRKKAAAARAATAAWPVASASFWHPLPATRAHPTSPMALPSASTRTAPSRPTILSAPRTGKPERSRRRRMAKRLVLATGAFGMRVRFTCLPEHLYAGTERHALLETKKKKKRKANSPTNRIRPPPHLLNLGARNHAAPLPRRRPPALPRQGRPRHLAGPAGRPLLPPGRGEDGPHPRHVVARHAPALPAGPVCAVARRHHGV